MSYGHITISYSHITISYGHITMSHAHITTSHGHITMSHGNITISYGHITIIYDHITILYDHITISYGHIKIRRPPLRGPPGCEESNFILRLCVSVCLRLAVCILLSGVCRLQSVDDGLGAPKQPNHLPPSTFSESCLPLEIFKK